VFVIYFNVVNIPVAFGSYFRRVHHCARVLSTQWHLYLLQREN